MVHQVLERRALFRGNGVPVDFVLDIRGTGSVAAEWPWAVFVILLMALMGLGLTWVSRRETDYSKATS
jgi:hypothetical protein